MNIINVTKRFRFPETYCSFPETYCSFPETYCSKIRSTDLQIGIKTTSCLEAIGSYDSDLRIYCSGLRTIYFSNKNNKVTFIYNNIMIISNHNNHKINNKITKYNQTSKGYNILTAII